MANELKASIVRIVSESGSIAGSGFLVSQKHVLTCAHVVAQALGIPSDTRERPADQIRLDFPFSEGNEIKTARVVCWKPVRSVLSTPPDRTEDIAALQLESDLPGGSHPCPVRAVDDLWEHPFRTLGFPVGYDDGTWAKGVILDAQAKGWVQIEGKTETGYPVGPGFSGTPVWDDQLGAVVGMVVVADKRSEVRAAFMIPINTLIKAWPDLQTEVTHSKGVAPKPATNTTGSRIKVGGSRILATKIFKTRDPEQKQVGELLADPSTRVVSVIGHAGIGKTTLASKVLNDLENGRWPHTEDEIGIDGIAYLSTRNGINFATLFEECAKMLGEEKKALIDAEIAKKPNLKTEDRVRLLLEGLEGGLYVILLDDIEDLLDEKRRFRDTELQTFFESSLSASDGARLLITSRLALNFPLDRSQEDNEIPLNKGLSEQDAIAMMRQLDRSGKGRLRDAKESELADAVNRVHRVPRALELIATKMVQNPLTKLDSILDGFYSQEEVVNLLFKQGYDQLDNRARKVMEALSVFGCSVPPDAVQYMLNEFASGIDAFEVLEQLLSIYMANSDGETVGLHPLDQEYVYDTLPDNGDYSRTTLERRAAEYYRERRTPRESWLTIGDLQPQLREFEHRVKAGDYDDAAEVLSEIDVDFLIWRGQAELTLRLRNQLNGKLTDQRQQMLHAYALGNIREVLGPFNEAINYFERARELAQEIGDKEIECHSAGSIGETYRRLGQLDKAIEHLTQSTAMAHGLDDVKKRSWHLLSLGLACIYHGDIKAGIEHANDLTEISAAAGDKMAEAQAYDCLSLAYLVLGQLRKTIEYSDKAVATYEEINERNGSMYVLNVRGMACLGLGELSEGIQSLEQAGKMAKDDCYARLEGFCFFNLACAYRMLGDMDKALQNAVEASKMLSDLDAAERSAANSLVKASRAASDGRRADEALALLDCARCSMTAPDIYDSDYFAEEARKIAQSEGRPEITAEAERIIEERNRQLILPD